MRVAEPCAGYRALWSLPLVLVNTTYTVECHTDGCGYTTDADTDTEAERLRREHLRHHRAVV